MTRFAEIVLKYRVAILIFLFLALLFSLYQGRNIKINNSVRIYFIENDPNLIDYELFEDTFGSDQFIALALKDEETVFTPHNLALIKEISAELKEIEGINSVMSITDSVDIWANDDGIFVAPLVDEIPKTASEIDALRDRINSNPLFIKTIISEDGKTALITARLAGYADTEETRPEIVRRTREVARKYEKEWGSKIYVAGVPVLNVDMNELTFRDLKVFIPITILLNIFILFFSMGRWSAAIISTTSMMISVALTMGIFNAFGLSLSMLTTMVPPMIMVIGISDSIHIINHYFDEMDTGGKKREVIIETIGTLGMPCLMTAITTVVGFSSFLFTKIEPLREIGLFAALGLSIAYIINVTYVPIVYSYLPPPKPRSRRSIPSGLITDFVMRICKIDFKRPVLVLSFGAALFFGSIYFITKINVDNQSLNFFKESHPLRKAYAFIENNVGYISPVEVVISGEPGIAQDPKVLNWTRSLQDFLLTIPNVSKSITATDLISRLNMAFFNNDPKEYRVPDSPEAVAQLLLLYETSEEGELSYFISFDTSKLRVSARARNLTSKECERLIEKIETYCRENLPPGLTGHVTGIIPLYVDMVDYIIQSQISSFTTSFFMIFLLMAIQLRSIRLGLISIVPNIIPIAMTMGAMGLFHINLDTATVMIASVATGIAVDDTIHFLNRFNLERSRGEETTAAIMTTFRTTGKAAVITSLTLVAGFWILVFGSFKPTIYFGFLSGITMLTAVFGDLFLLPACLILFLPKKKRNKGDPCAHLNISSTRHQFFHLKKH